MIIGCCDLCMLCMFFQKVSDLLGRFDGIQDWHAEVSEDDAVRHSVFVRFHHFLNTLLSIYAEVNFI